MTHSVARQRPIRDFGDRVFTRSCILPGGRWLLVLMSEEVYAVDLDSPQLKPHRLLQPETHTSLGRFTQCRHWVDDTKSRLSFRVGLAIGLGSLRESILLHRKTLIGISRFRLHSYRALPG